MAQLQRLWSQAQSGQGQLALMVGEPGIGKTRLLQELIAHAELQRALILRGGCYEFEATTPYLPFEEKRHFGASRRALVRHEEA